jgi:hypothetical protein
MSHREAAIPGHRQDPLGASGGYDGILESWFRAEDVIGR